MFNVKEVQQALKGDLPWFFHENLKNIIDEIAAVRR